MEDRMVLLLQAIKKLKGWVEVYETRNGVNEIRNRVVFKNGFLLTESED